MQHWIASASHHITAADTLTICDYRRIADGSSRLCGVRGAAGRRSDVELGAPWARTYDAAESLTAGAPVRRSENGGVTTAAGETRVDFFRGNSRPRPNHSHSLRFRAAKQSASLEKNAVM
jgi:hypothetical protein